MIYIYTLMAFILMTFIIQLVTKNKDIIEIIALSFVGFCSIYIVISGCYFWIDSWKLEYALITIIIMEVLICLANKDKIVNLFRLKLKKVDGIPLVIALLMLPVVVNTYGFFGMGQDQGVYQTKAINLINRVTDRNQEFENYYLLEDEQDRNNFTDIIWNSKKLAGFDKYDYRMPTLKRGESDPTTGIFHGIPTFAALLALWGTMFGIANMSSINTIFFICAISLVYSAIKNLGMGKKISAIGTVIFAISPIVVWVSKSALTEMFLTTVMCTYLFFLTESENKNKGLFMTLPIITFAFYHVSIYTMMPIFVIVFIVLYIWTQDKKYLIGNIIGVIGFWLGYSMMCEVSPTYTFNNSKQLYILGDLINKDNVWLIITITCMMVILISLILGKMNIKRLLGVISRKDYVFKFNLLVYAIFFIMQIILVVKNQLEGYGYGGSIHRLGIWGFISFTGIIIIPFILIRTLKNSAVVIKSKERYCIWLLFLYCVMFYSSIKNIPHYYYYGRYFSPFIPIVAIMSTIYMYGISKKLLYGVSFISVMSMIPFNYVLATQLDDTRMEWNVLSEVQKKVTNKDAVIVDTDVLSYFFFPIHAMTGADVYPEYTDITKINNSINKEYENIYFITDEMVVNDGSCSLDVVYRNPIETSLDLNTNHGRIIPLALDFTQNQGEVIMYRFNNITTEYDFSEINKVQYYGFGDLEGDFVWSNKEKAQIKCYIEKKNYDLSIIQGPGIPFDKLGLEKLELKVYMNDHLIESIMLSKETNGKNLEIFIPENVIQDNENIISFETKLWSPSDYGVLDGRKLGFSLKGIQFKEIPDKREYNLGEEDTRIDFNGFSVNENTFRWTNQEVAELNIGYMENGVYELEIYLGCKIPFNQIENNMLQGYIMINDIMTTKKEFKLNTDIEKISFSINIDDIEGNSSNVLRISTNLWNPKNDSRNLGVPIDKVVLTKRE